MTITFQPFRRLLHMYNCCVNHIALLLTAARHAMTQKESACGMGVGRAVGTSTHHREQTPQAELG